MGMCMFVCRCDPSLDQVNILHIKDLSHSFLCKPSEIQIIALIMVSFIFLLCD